MSQTTSNPHRNGSPKKSPPSVCNGESSKDTIKLTVIKGASLKDPAQLFNTSLDGNARRALDIFEGNDVDATAFKALIREAVALNGARKSKPAKKPEVAWLLSM